MNKVKWLELGGPEIRNDDWQYEADAVRDALKGLGSILGDNAILSGCVPTDTGSGYTFSAGYVLINGEVYAVAAVTAPINFDEDNNYFVVQAINEVPAGETTLETLLTAEIYENRTATIVYDNSSVPANSIGWLSAYNNRLAKVAFDAIMAQTQLPLKGVFTKRLSGSPLAIVSGIVDFDSANGNFARVTTADSTITGITFTLSGGFQPFMFMLKVTGTGYLKVEHGVVLCPGQRDHYFKTDDVLIFVNDGGIPTSFTHLLSVGSVSSGWTDVTTFGTGSVATTGIALRYKKEDGFVTIDGSATLVSGFAGTIFTLPAGLRPTRFNRTVIALWSNPTETNIVCRLNTDGTVTIPSGSIVLNDAVYFSMLRIPLE